MHSRPWYRRYPDNFIAGVAGLSLEEKGAYSMVLDLIYARGGPIADEPRWIAGVCNCSPRKWNAIRQRLIDLGKLVAADGQIWNIRALEELEVDRKRAEKHVENGSKGGNKSAEMRATINGINDLAQARLNHIREQRTDTPIVPKGAGSADGYGNEADPLYTDFLANVWAKRWKRKGHEPLPAFRAYRKLTPKDRENCKAAVERAGRGIVALASEERFRPLLATWINKRGWEADDGATAEGTATNWPAWVAAFRANGDWNPVALGPAPGQPGCRVPRQFLVGLAEDAA